MLAAIFRAIAMALQSVWWLLMQGGHAIDWTINKLFGGGGPAPAPVPNLKIALDDPEEKIVQAQEMVKGVVRAAETISKMSPAIQAQVFASMPAKDRGLADLSLLSDDQVDWLNGLVEGQLRIVAESSERRVEAALNGDRNSLPAILSVGQPDPESETALAARIAAKRLGNLAPTPFYTAPVHTIQ
ncbi:MULTISPECIES: hypothetical protein [unclassified Ensifer]|uniref:hypothetical protein n=1 Tax=unclassified Ensifer TaxID=2633371 RepID=UPI0008137D11|nr:MULTISPECIES: hypothetical protein [unclassified Ensifer]OCP08005.1 hypothetical protein BC362_10365 [Ensifer sp. LC14]OCP10885.1 hypothetical protein BC374_17600 [Ensifer sp. LC13]OCP11569.1 hypothetical protein BBX50_18255 [Ensifer sp. LC11]OCP33388.1 hypothetical protein BC364_17145 [Ensifer sp. LC499]